jgi:hypothetical protein
MQAVCAVGRSADVDEDGLRSRVACRSEKTNCVGDDGLCFGSLQVDDPHLQIDDDDGGVLWVELEIGIDHD